MCTSPNEQKKLRHQTPLRLGVFLPFSQRAPLEEGLRLVRAAGLELATNMDLSRVLIGSAEWKSLSTAFPCWTGTMCAYVEHSKSFKDDSERISSLDNGHYIVYYNPVAKKRFLFQIPEEHLDASDSVLVTEFPRFSMQIEKKDVVIVPGEVQLVGGFPPFPGRYKGDSAFDIPSGEPVQDGPVQDWDANLRFLVREAKWVGLASRNCNGEYNRRTIYLNSGPFSGFGIVVRESGENAVGI